MLLRCLQVSLKTYLRTPAALDEPEHPALQCSGYVPVFKKNCTYAKDLPLQTGWSGTWYLSSCTHIVAEHIEGIIDNFIGVYRFQIT